MSTPMHDAADEARDARNLAALNADPWLCGTCAKRHANACPRLWGGDFVPAPGWSADLAADEARDARNHDPLADMSALAYEFEARG